MGITKKLPALPEPGAYQHYLIVYADGVYNMQLFHDKQLTWLDNSLVFSWSNSQHYILSEDSWVLDGNPLNTRYDLSVCQLVATDADLYNGDTLVLRGSNAHYLKGGTITVIGSSIADNAFYGVLMGCADIAVLILPVLVGFLAFRKAYSFLTSTIKGA